MCSLATERWRSPGGHGAVDLHFRNKLGTPFPLRCTTLLCIDYGRSKKSYSIASVSPRSIIVIDGILFGFGQVFLWFAITDTVMHVASQNKGVIVLPANRFIKVANARKFSQW